MEHYPLSSTLASLQNFHITHEILQVKLDSTIQSQEFSTPTESVQFEFKGLDFGSKTYLVVLNFSLISDSTTNIHTVTNIINGTITTTPAPDVGNRFSAWNFLLLLVSLAIFVSSKHTRQIFYSGVDSTTVRHNLSLHISIIVMVKIRDL